MTIIFGLEFECVQIPALVDDLSPSAVSRLETCYVSLIVLLRIENLTYLRHMVYCERKSIISMSKMDVFVIIWGAPNLLL